MNLFHAKTKKNMQEKLDFSLCNCLILLVTTHNNSCNIYKGTTATANPDFSFVYLMEYVHVESFILTYLKVHGTQSFDCV